MAKVTGLGWTTLTVDNAAGAGQDIRNDITNLDWSTPYGVQEVTGIDKSAMERLALLADMSGTLNGVFNPSANKIYDVLIAGDLRVIRTVAIVISGKSLSTECLFTDAKVTRNANGELTTQHPFVLADGTVPTWV